VMQHVLIWRYGLYDMRIVRSTSVLSKSSLAIIIYCILAGFRKSHYRLALRVVPGDCALCARIESMCASLVLVSHQRRSVDGTRFYEN